MKRIITVFLAALFLYGAMACKTSSGAKSPGLKIAVIPKGTTHEFWKSIHAGAIKAAQELSTDGKSVEIIWKGPLREDDREQQIQVVEGFTSQGVSGLVLAPLDNRALVRPVEEAQRAGIPSVIIDSALDTGDVTSFVATDNIKGGELAADELGRLLGGHGKILVLRCMEGSASTEAREKGFFQELKAKFPGIELVSADQYGGSTRDTAKRASENLLNRYANDIQGVFTSAEPTTAGMLLALQDIDKAGKVAFVGFDSNQTFIDAMRNKQLQAFVVQNPFKMGYLGVRTLVDHLQGKPVEKRVDTGVTLITPDNLDSKDSQELLHPPLEQYLK